MGEALLALLLSASGAEPVEPAAAPRTVAMLPPRAEAGLAQGTANLLGEVIAADASRAPRYKLMTASDVAAVLSTERQRQLMGCSNDTSCIAEIGSALGADLLLDVSVGSVGNLKVLAMRLVDARSGAALRRQSETVATEAELIDACHRLTAQLFELPPLTRRGRIMPGVLTLGGAGALAALGLVFGLMANTDVRAFQADPFNDALGDRAKLQAGVADGFYAGALLAAGVSAFLIITGLMPARGAP